MARRLPSLGARAWGNAPLLPWRVQCPVCVCAALAAGSGGSGRYLVLCLSRFPLPAPRVPRCLWRAVPSGCFLPSLAGTPFHAVCAFRELGPFALLVVPACPLRVCALALPRRPLPPPLGGVACAPRAVPALGARRAVPRGQCPSACPAPVPCSVWLAWGGGGPVPVPPYLAWPARPVRAACRGGGGGLSPGGGWPATGVRGVWCQALSLPRSPVLWGGQPGYRDPRFPGAVGVGVGTQHRFHSVRPCGPALLSVEVAERRPRGGCLPPLLGASEVRRCPSPDCPPTGRAVGVRNHVLWARVCGCGGRTLSPWPACPVGAACRGGGGGPSPGGVACHHCEGRLVSGAVSPPAARPLGQAAGVPRPVCPGCGRCGRGDPAPSPQRAPLRAGVACCGNGGMVSPEGCLPPL